MNIVIDIRPLLDAKRTGVGEYTYQLVKNILRNDKKNHYILFWNSFSKPEIDFDEFKSENSTICSTRIPNKIFNSLLLLKLISLQKIIEKKTHKHVDLFFYPNIGFICKKSTAPYSITAHDISYLLYPHFYSIKRRLWHFVLNPQKQFDNAQKIICVSHHTKNDLISYCNCNEEKLFVTHLGLPHFSKNLIPQEKKSLRKKYSLPKEFILFLGTLEPRKNIGTLIKAFNSIKDSKIGLVIIGKPGWKYKKIFSLLKKSPKKHQIFVIDYIEESEKHLFYSLAQLFVFPSHYEGFGLPPLEAYMHKTPVITGFGSSMNEILTNNVTYVNSFNTNELTQAIDVLLNERCAKKNRNVNSKKFSWEKTAQQTIQIFNQK